MLHEVVYAPLALQDLDSIWDYIETELVSPKAAANTVQGILDAVAHLATFPLMGTSLEGRGIRGSSYRFISSGNYLAFYRVAESTVYVDRILYAKSDYLRTLLGNEPEAADA